MQNPEYVKGAFAEIADRYVVTNHVLSMGIDILWRRKVAKMVAAIGPKRVLDVATGSGDLAIAIKKRCPQAKVIGTDFCEPMLAHAARRGVEETIVADALDLPFDDGEFDALTVGFGLRNMADYEAALKEVGRVLRPGGLLVILDFSLPKAAWLRVGYRFYLHKVLPRVAGLLTGKREAYEYLGGTIESFPSGDDMVALIERCGFEEGKAAPVSGGIASIYSAGRSEA